MIGVILILLTVLLLDGFSHTTIEVANIVPNAVSILAISGIISAISYKFKYFFKKEVFFYVLALGVAVLGVVFYQEPWTYYITKGLLGYGFLTVVMFVGVLPNKWTLSRNIKRYRGVFSIMAFILISPHAMLRIFGLLGTVDLFGIASYVIMVPLTIISFKIIRREIDPKDWFKIQKAAYVIYLLLFVHLLVVASWQDKVIYAVLLTLYVNNKLLKEFRK